jgi:hypothetical protein
MKIPSGIILYSRGLRQDDTGNRKNENIDQTLSNLPCHNINFKAIFSQEGDCLFRQDSRLSVNAMMPLPYSADLP